MFSTQEYKARPRMRMRDSLQWRLPLVSGTIILLLLSAFLWTSFRQVEATLTAASVTRAAGAAGEISTRLTASAQRLVAGTALLQGDSALHALLRDPGDDTRREYRASLRRERASTSAGRIEVWDADGALLFSMDTPPPARLEGDTTRLAVFPAGSPPSAPGISALKRAGRLAYFEVTTPIRADSSAATRIIGYHRRFGQLTSSGMSINELLGSSAIVRIGAPGTPTWTDFEASVTPMASVADRDPGLFLASDGSQWIGGSAGIQGTPWEVWVGYPRTVVMAPAHAFLGRMLSISLVFLVVGVTLATALGRRITRPLNELALAADQIAGGDYAQRVRATRSDEIGTAGRAFNFMTDRVEQAYEDLRTSHDRTQAILAMAHIGVWQVDLATGSMACSHSMCVVHGAGESAPPRTREEFLSQVHPEHRHAISDVLYARHPQPDAIHLQYRTQVAGGPAVWIDATAHVRVDATGRPTTVLGVSKDVTAQREVEMQLRQAQKMDAVGQLAGGVAHDFNNLLTAIIGHAELLRDDIPEQSIQREGLDEILKASASAADLTRQLLAFSRKQVRRAEVISVNDVVTRSEKLLARLIGENIRIITQLPPGLDAVVADAGQVEQVIVNLVVNARDAMPNGGTVTIATAAAHLSAEYVREHATNVKPGEYTVLSVTDTGTGMSAETRRHLFEPFFTTKPQGKGTGLGLATVFGIVAQSGGHVHVVSQEGSGSTFSVFLPATRDVPDAALAPAPRTPAPRGGESILIVDDNHPVRAIATRILRSLGYTVRTAENGDEALRLFNSMSEPVDLLVTDVVMPGLSGPELARELIAIRPSLRVLFTSGYSGAALTRHGIEETEATFIEKPYTAKALAAAVRAALLTVP